MSLNLQTIKEYAVAGGYAAAGSFASNTLAYPFEVVKTNQQMTGAGAVAAVKSLVQTKGLPGLYAGYTAKIATKAINGLWVLPTMKFGLSTLKEHTNLPPEAQQAVTGTGVAAISAFLTTPFEKAKVRAIMAQKAAPTPAQGAGAAAAAPPKPAFSVPEFVRRHWQGVGTNWFNCSVRRSSFLMAQKYFQVKPDEQDPLKYIETGAKVSCITTAATTGIDVVATQKMAKGATVREIITSNSPTVFVRGVIPSFLSLVVRNSVSAWVMNKIGI